MPRSQMVARTRRPGPPLISADHAARTHAQSGTEREASDAAAASYGRSWCGRAMDYPVLAAASTALLLYFNTLGADFAYDDSRAIQKNPDLLPETPLANIFYDDFWGTPLTHSGSHKSYRPLCVLTFRLNHLLGGLDPWGYHLGNVLCHAAVSALFAYVARIFLRRTLPTMVAALLFAAHPVHTEAVAGIVGRADVGACGFFLLTLLAYRKYVRARERGEGAGGRLGWMAAVWLLTAAAMLTKEQAIAVLAVCAVYDVLIVHRLQPRHLPRLLLLDAQYRGLVEGVLLLGMCGGSLLAFRVSFMGNKPPEFAPSDNPASDSDSLLTRTLTYHLLPALNLWLLLCPRVLSFDWSMESVPLVESLHDPRNLCTLALYAGLTLTAWAVLSSLGRCSGSSPAAAARGSTPPHVNGNGVLNNNLHHHQVAHQHNGGKSPIPNGGKVKGVARQQRRGSGSSTDESLEEGSCPPLLSQTVDVVVLALSMMVFPFIPASNMFFYVGFVLAERILYIPSMGACLLVGQGVFLLVMRARQSWQRQAVKGSVVLLFLLFSAKTVLRNRDWQTEEKLYASGLAVNPAKAWGNLANVWNGQGRKSEAETAYRNALQYRPNMADVHYNLGILLQDQKRYREAMESYKRAINFRPKLSVAHLNLGILTAQEGDDETAARIYRHCADLDTSGLKDPRLHENTKISCLYNLGHLYTKRDRLQEAVEVFNEALRRRPSYYAPQSIYNMMGEVYTKRGDYGEAERWYREALKAKPDHVPAHLTMAKLCQKRQQPQQAETWFKKAKEVDPHDSAIDNHYAQFLMETGRMAESAQVYESILKRGVQDFDVLFNAANAFRQLGQNKEAEKLYRRAVELKPEFASAHMNLGAMLHMNGHLEEAEQSYLAALRLKPDDEMTKNNLQKLRNLMDSPARASTAKTQTANAGGR